MLKLNAMRKTSSLTIVDRAKIVVPEFENLQKNIACSDPFGGLIGGF